jgi:hypothetical protein
MARDSTGRQAGVFVRPVARQRPAERQPHDPPADGPSVAATIDAFLAAVDDGAAHDRDGRPYDHAADRELRWWLGGHLRETLGAVPIDDVRRRHLEALVDELRYAGISPRRLHRLAVALGALFEYAGALGLTAGNPAEPVLVALPAGTRSSPARNVGGRRVADRAFALGTGLATLAVLAVAATFLLESV